jgi:hypothetical protein
VAINSIESTLPGCIADAKEDGATMIVLLSHVSRAVLCCAVLCFAGQADAGGHQISVLAQTVARLRSARCGHAPQRLTPSPPWPAGWLWR